MTNYHGGFYTVGNALTFLRHLYIGTRYTAMGAFDMLITFEYVLLFNITVKFATCSPVFVVNSIASSRQKSVLRLDVTPMTKHGSSFCN